MTTTTAVQLDIAPLSGTIGAEIRNIDLHQPLDPETLAAVRQALLDYKVIFFPGQHLSPSRAQGLRRRLRPDHGRTPRHPRDRGAQGGLRDRLHEGPRSSPTASGREDGDRERWHTDVTFVETPPLGSVLNAIVIPPAGGDTLWADTQAAYEGLSAPIRDLVDGLTAIHDGTRAFGSLLEAVGQGEWDGVTFTELTPTEHPVVRTHPETGRRNLFVNPGFTKRIKGLTTKESDTLLHFLYEHMTTPEYVVRYRWEEGDLGFWDNRTTMHYAIGDYGDAHRVIQRVTIQGDKPF